MNQRKITRKIRKHLELSEKYYKWHQNVWDAAKETLRNTQLSMLREKKGLKSII